MRCPVLLLFLTTLVALPLVLAPQTLRAQTNRAARDQPNPSPPSDRSSPRIHLGPNDARDLATALRTISQQAPVAFVAEGKPYRARNSAPPLTPVLTAWPAEGVSLGEAVAKTADVYDYEATRRGDLFLLTKRYTHADDLPNIPAEELRLVLRDASQAASALPLPTIPTPDISAAKDPFAWAFYQTLTAEQKKTLVDPANFLFVSDLNAKQKQMMRELAQSRFIQNAVEGVQKAYAALQATNQKSTTFHWADNPEPPVRVLGIDVRLQGRNELYPFAPGGRMRFRWGNRSLTLFEKGEALPSDTTAPQPTDYGPNHEPLPRPREVGPDVFTLQTLAERLSQKNGAQYAPAPELAAKSVLVIGLENPARHESLWRAAGEVYGLRAVRTDAKGALRLLRPRAHVARDFSDLNAAVFASFPAPLVRLQIGALSAAEAMQRAALFPTDGEQTGSARALEEGKIMAFSQARAPEAIKGAIFHRLRVLLEPRIWQNPNQSVSFREMSAEEHDLWTLALVVECLDEVRRLEGAGVPPTLTNFDEG